jgi:hypothetical protein
VRKENEFGGTYYSIDISPANLQWVLDLLAGDFDSEFGEKSQEIYNSFLRQMGV